jgi:hypothetical protein
LDGRHPRIYERRLSDLRAVPDRIESMGIPKSGWF